MRGVLLLLPILLLMGCKDEPDFDARYDKAAQDIEARAKAMDADIAASEAAAKAVGEPVAASDQAVESGGKIPRVAPEPLPETVNPTNPPPSSGE